MMTMLRVGHQQGSVEHKLWPAGSHFGHARVAYRTRKYGSRELCLDWAGQALWCDLAPLFEMRFRGYIGISVGSDQERNSAL
jgi:hypothetical protein